MEDGHVTVLPNVGVCATWRRVDLHLHTPGGRWPLCQVRARGSIDDAAIRKEIRTVLEGGADAFRRRAEKYGGLDDA